VIGAHYDHLGLGGEGSAAPDEVGQVHPGADDNASGTAAMLEVARAFAARPAPKRTLVFVAFAGEELGVLGSAHYTKAPPSDCPLDRTQVMINLDMVGRPTSGKLYVYGVDTAKGLRERVAALVERPPRIALHAELAGTGFGASDQTSFYTHDVPVLFLFNGAHLDYHRPSDTADKIDPGALAEAARLAWRAAVELADAPARLEVVRAASPGPSGSRGGPRPWLGTIPDFSERSAPGVAIAGVQPGSPAEKAGLAAGDVLLRIGDKKVLNLQDMQYALVSHRPGDVVEVEYSRGGRPAVVAVTLAERR
jgi:membrane-associated protease RseP (regulator of RpoE activity)